MTGGGGAGAFFFLLRVIPSFDDASDDVDPLKLWPGELLENERSDGSGVVDCLQYLYFNMISFSFLHFLQQSNDKWDNGQPSSHQFQRFL